MSKILEVTLRDVTVTGGLTMIVKTEEDDKSTKTVSWIPHILDPEFIDAAVDMRDAMFAAAGMRKVVDANTSERDVAANERVEWDQATGEARSLMARYELMSLEKQIKVVQRMEAFLRDATNFLKAKRFLAAREQPDGGT